MTKGLALDLRPGERVTIHVPGAEPVYIYGRKRTSPNSAVLIDAPRGWRVDRTPPDPATLPHPDFLRVPRPGGSAA